MELATEDLRQRASGSQLSLAGVSVLAHVFLGTWCGERKRLSLSLQSKFRPSSGQYLRVQSSRSVLYSLPSLGTLCAHSGRFLLVIL